jgi:Uma2 family endonuclease
MNAVTRKRFTISEYHRLIELGFLTENDRVELIRGELMQMAAKGTLHSVCTTKLYRELDKLIGDTAVIRCQEPIILHSDSEPETDIAIARGQPDDYVSSHPFPQDILLLIEVSDSTVNYDQNTKLELYAIDGIPNYWIINLVAYQLECYSNPLPNIRGNFVYSTKQIVFPQETIKLPIFSNLSLELNQIFPRLELHQS